MDFSQSTLIGTLKDTRSRQRGDSTSWCLKRKRKKYTLLPHKTTEVLGVADFEVACVASVSSRGSSRKLAQGQKKNKWRGRGRGMKEPLPLLLSPSPFNLFFCFRSNFRAITRLETLATQANFEGWDLVENVISLVFARLSTLLFSFSLFICLNGASVHTLPRVPEVVSGVRQEASFCRPKAEVKSGEAFRACHFFRLTETGYRAWKASGTQGIHT